MREHKESDLDLARIKTALVDADYQEAITYSFVDPKIQSLLHPHQEATCIAKSYFCGNVSNARVFD